MPPTSAEHDPEFSGSIAPDNPQIQEQLKPEEQKALEGLKTSAEFPSIDGYTDFQILDAKGSYGTVYSAREASGGDYVAIKVFKVDNTEVAKHFNTTVIEEIRKISQAGAIAKGIVGIKTHGTIRNPGKFQNHFYYVMPLASGGSLKSLLKKRGPLPLKDALEMFKEVVETMMRVHEKGIIHGDIKPGNILLNESEQPLVSDFGVNNTGTYLYMPPEQAEPEAVPDTRWDVYALGATFYEMITSKRPRESSAMLSALNQARLAGETTNRSFNATSKVYIKEMKEAPYIELRKLNPRVDRELSAIVRECLSNDPSERPRSAGHIHQRLQHRTQWRRITPVLSRLGIAIALLLALSIIAAVSATRYFIRVASDSVKKEIIDSLRQRAYIGSELMKVKMHDRIRVLEAIANEVRKDTALRIDLMKIQQLYDSRPPDEKPGLLTQERRELLESVSRRLEHYHNTIAIPRFPVGETKRMGFLLTMNGKSYLVGLINENDKWDTRLDNELYFGRSFSWRDFFHGGGNLQAEKNLPHIPMENILFSQVYKSTIDGKLKFDISLPIRFERENRFQSHMTIGIDVRTDLARWLAAPRVSDATDNVETILINDRNCWIYHSAFDQDEAALVALLKDQDLKPIYDIAPWVVTAPGSKMPDEYIDPLDHPMSEIDKAEKRELKARYDKADAAGRESAEFESLRSWFCAQTINFPKGLTADGKEYTPRPWTLVAQIRVDKAEAAIEKMQVNLRYVGYIILMVVILLLGGFSAYLYRLLVRIGKETHV